jgi:creatinine amidohydrolase
MAGRSILDVIGADVGSVASRASLAVVPFGSVEYHGPHAPLGTDSFIATELAERVSGRLDGILCPLIAYTACPVWTREYQGTVSIDSDVMTAYVEDVFRGLLSNDMKGLLAINAHDGNIDVIKRAVERLFFDFDDQFIILINWWQTLPTSTIDELDLFSREGGHGHGGPLETSAAWAVRPDTVDLGRAQDVDSDYSAPEMMSILSFGGARPAWQGYHGRISESSVEKGEQLLQLAEDRIVQLVGEWLQNRRQAT